MSITKLDIYIWYWKIINNINLYSDVSQWAIESVGEGKGDLLRCYASKYAETLVDTKKEYATYSLSIIFFLTTNNWERNNGHP